MIQKFYLLIIMMGLSFTVLQAQADNTFDNINAIPDSMTIDPEQNAKWREGEAIYPAKPKDAWELGVHFGHFFISGDVDMSIPGGYGLGLHLRKAIHYAFSVRADVFYGQAAGFDPQPWSHSSQGGGLVEPTFNDYNPLLGTSGQGEWFPKYKTRQVYGAVQGVLNIGNILFHDNRNKWNWYMTVGAGFANHKTKLDLLDADDNAYTNLRQAVDWSSAKFNTKSGRAEIKDALNDIYDGDYETEGFKKSGIFRLGDDINFHVVLTTSMGISRKISKRFNIGIEHQVMLQDNDYLDGVKFRTALDQTNNADIGHYTNIRLAINLGDLDKRTEPLYWLNPLNTTLNDIAELKRRPIFDLSDDDNDGVINKLDQELNTLKGYPVSTKGIALDSDGDGYPDGFDHEIYSPPGFEVDTVGVANVPIYTTPDDVTILIDDKIAPLVAKIDDCCNECKGDWFLPMIHFDTDKSDIKTEYYGRLKHVAEVMELCPNVCVTAVGHTDARNTNNYNTTLSYKRAIAAVDYIVSNYGIDSSRFITRYSGENALIDTNGKEDNFMNRRVEFRVCNDADVNMSEPITTPPVTIKSKYNYRSNKNSGY